MDRTETEALDPAFAARDAARKAGLPVEIAVTRRLLIRETILEDVPALFEIGRKEKARGIKAPQKTLEEELDFMRAYIAHAYPFYDFGLWTVLERQSGRVVGRAGLSVSERLEDAVELGYLIAPDCRRQGYGWECSQAIVQYAFTVLELPKLHLLAAEENLASKRLAEKLGFRLHGQMNGWCYYTILGNLLELR